MIREVKRTVASGYLMLVVLAAAQLGLAYMIYLAGSAQNIGGLVAAVLASIVVLICWAGPTRSTRRPRCQSASATSNPAN